MEKGQRGKRVKAVLLDGLCYVAGSLLFAVSVNVFTAPNNIAPAGLTGVATMLNHLFHTPIGITILVLNVPLLIWAAVEEGARMVAKTAVATVVSSLAIDLTLPLLNAYQGDLMLASLFGGVIGGIGLGLIFMRGGTTGGTDLAASLIGHHLRHISLGKLILFLDLLVVLSSAFVYRNLESPLYAVISIFVMSKVIDAVLYGTDSGTGKMMFIVSPKNKEIAASIMKELERGVTELRSRGGYSGIEGEVLLCAVRRQESYKVRDLAYSLDPNAFIIVGDAGEITGEGFREIQRRKERKRRKAQRKRKD